MKALVIYQFNEEKFGYRPHMFDWSVGDRILCDGKRATIIKIVEASQGNLRFLKNVMDECRRVLNSKRYEWKDGTGYSHFRDCVNLLPDFEF